MKMPWKEGMLPLNHHGLIGIHHFQIEDTIDTDGHLRFTSPKVASALRKSCEFFFLWNSWESLRGIYYDILASHFC